MKYTKSSWNMIST